MPARLTAAVFVLFCEHEGEPSLLLIKRSETLGRHRGEWAFPGGVVEPGDRTLMDTALRETVEELGVSPEAVDRWGALDAVMTSSGYLVWPFTGRLNDAAEISPSEREVADVIKAPLNVFTDESAVRTITLMQESDTRNWQAYAYNGRIIWGATARIIRLAIDAIGSSSSQVPVNVPTRRSRD
ncbi:MAG: CoA pyrophosphatase [Dehalococcoidia bacterium]